VHADVCGADAVVLVTPVYWGEMSESAKAFTDRLRRCEATAGVQSRMAGTPIILVAAAGGSGNGTVSCLESMERFAKAVGTRQFDIVSVNRWNREYKIRTIRDSTAAMSGELARK
jgi:multimeric flavodoxin WrbA